MNSYMNTLFQTLFMNNHFRNMLLRFRSQSECSSPHIQSNDDQSLMLIDSQSLSPAVPFDTSNHHQSATSTTPAAAAAATAASSSSSSNSEGVKADDGILCELQNLFARLQFGRASFEDPTRIVKRLCLATGEQQDINEFSNLLLQYLESRLKLSNLVGMATLIDDEFKGVIVHSIRCQSCGTRRDNRSAFYDVCFITIFVL